MHRRMPLLTLLLALTAVAVLSAPALAQKMTYTKKVDNFVFVDDTSGSMGGAYCDMNQPKSVLAKDMLTKLNAQIPELDYNAGLCTFASYELVKAPAIYDRAAYGQAIAGLPTDVVSFGFVGNPTPLGVGLRDFEAVLKTLKGKTAVIILTDGGQNKDIDPVKVATHLAKTYDICLHILSFAQTTSEKATVEALRAVTPCTVPAAIDELGTDTARFEYLKKILFTEAPAVAAPAPAPADKDSDGDGVFDSKDKCPDTPKTHKVDANGCSIPATMEIMIEFDFDKSDIRTEYAGELKKFAEFAAQYPTEKITIEGHTDGVGTDAYNQKLSERRAQAVVNAPGQGLRHRRQAHQGRGLRQDQAHRPQHHRGRPPAEPPRDGRDRRRLPQALTPA